jgi:hypothetical protein
LGVNVDYLTATGGAVPGGAAKANKIGMIADFETETVKRCAASTRVAKQIFVAK